MEEIKRYNIITYMSGHILNEKPWNKPLPQWRASEDKDGKWVKYDDIKHLLEKPKCNCEEKALKPQGGCQYWLCPAHGYKRR